MEELGPELKAELSPRLKGKPQERQRQWIQISDAVYRLVYEQAKVRFEAVLSKLQLARPAMEAVIRTDMDQIITSKEHLASKIRGTCWDRGPRADLLSLSWIWVHFTT